MTLCKKFASCIGLLNQSIVILLLHYRSARISIRILAYCFSKPHGSDLVTTCSDTFHVI